MAVYRLVDGKHNQADMDSEPDPKTGKRKSKQYVKGDLVPSAVDLSKLLGSNKFQLVDERDVPERMRARERSAKVAATPIVPPAGHGVFPGGQVSSGLQETTSAGGQNVSHVKDDPIVGKGNERGETSSAPLPPYADKGAGAKGVAKK